MEAVLLRTGTEENGCKTNRTGKDCSMKAGEERLDAFEKMLLAVQNEYADVQVKMEKMKTEDRTKSATYRQLMGRKMTLQSMLTTYEVYGLTEKQKA